MSYRAVRGATSVEANEARIILGATRRLLERLVAANGLSVDDIVSVTFTATPDLDAAYPARAAREMGWANTPLMCMQEMAVADSLPRCIRVLLLCSTNLRSDQIRHIYLGRTRALRPDLSEESEK